MEARRTCYGPVPEEVLARLARIRAVIFDIDGTLTDGGIILGTGDFEAKRFYSRDGLGIVMLQRHGLIPAVITGRSSAAVTRRMAELRVRHVIQGVSDKAVALSDLARSLDLAPADFAVLGDDLNDLPLFDHCGFTACPHDAHPFIRARADLVTQACGGHGAGREICDLLLIAHGLLGPDGGPC